MTRQEKWRARKGVEIAGWKRSWVARDVGIYGNVKRRRTEEEDKRIRVRTGSSKAEEITRAEAAAAAAMTPHKPMAGGNIFFMDDKEIIIVEKKTLAQDTWRKRTHGVLKNVQWSDLPMDLLMLVTERLTPADHVRMSITCKSWQCTAPSILFSKIPVLLFIKNHTSNFFDPSSKKKHLARLGLRIVG
ncbi:hypothetical protein CKAN_00060700 [Cinnamomum micranthum f. kanehirae]|uniref:F-box domain-containing protein n=1 Tax=Cinnamomum micranthum f. kanehirae TaxID=337451 RepID=A0A443N1I9_9MAGN|nr:hypothetical protein CKAN_00060700 [Cinnamomum micranthum f. kanehirae]